MRERPAETVLYALASLVLLALYQDELARLGERARDWYERRRLAPSPLVDRAFKEETADDGGN